MFLFLLLVNMITAWATPVVVPAPNSVSTEYRAYIIAHSEYSTPTDALLRSRPSAAAREQLVALFAEAQRAFLEGPSNVARSRFETLLSHVHDEDWSQTERQVFFTAALRRAQLSLENTDQSLWINLAVSLGLGLTPDQVQFPPPLVQLYKTAEKSAPRPELKLNGLGSEWTVILINGIRCTLEKCPPIPDSGVPVRITYLSDQWQPFTTVGTVAQITKQIPVRKAWLDGDCRSPRMDRATSQLNNAKPFFSMSCEEAKLASREINFQPLPPLPGSMTMFTPPNNDKPFYKSPWLWAGVGVAAAVLILQSQKKQGSRQQEEPSTTYGSH